MQVDVQIIDEYTLIVIPDVAIPLNPHSCTCSDLEDAAAHFQLPIPGVTHQCSVDSSTCFGVLCHISYADTRLDTAAVIDPCSESITVTVNDSVTGHQVFHQIFSHSDAVQFTVGNFTPTVYVLICQYTYSMAVSVSMYIEHCIAPLKGMSG